MKKQLAILILFLFTLSCQENDDNQNGVIDSFAIFEDYKYLTLEKYLVNKVVTTKIEYIDEDLSYDINQNQIQNYTSISTEFENIDLTNVFFNDKESKLLEYTEMKFFVNGGLNEDSLLKFNEFENILELDYNNKSKIYKFKLSEPVTFKNLKRDDIVSKNSDLILNWNSNVSKFAMLNIRSSNFMKDNVTNSWLIPNTGSITISKKLLKEFKSGIYNFTITRYDFIPLEIEEGKNCLIEFESSQGIAVKLE